ncbi:MAG: hypothetical protein Q4A28_01190 [Brachymonas sp.]|nr:hypothetical protein [Brachymonas sp.]
MSKVRKMALSMDGFLSLVMESVAPHSGQPGQMHQPLRSGPKHARGCMLVLPRIAGVLEAALAGIRRRYPPLFAAIGCDVFSVAQSMCAAGQAHLAKAKGVVPRLAFFLHFFPHFSLHGWPCVTAGTWGTKATPTVRQTPSVGGLTGI